MLANYETETMKIERDPLPMPFHKINSFQGLEDLLFNSDMDDREWFEAWQPNDFQNLWDSKAPNPA